MMSTKSTLATAALGLTATALVTLAPSAGAATAAPSSPAVSAQAHIIYKVNGTTATITPYMTGTQHWVKAGDNGATGPSALPWQFEVHTPGGTFLKGNAAGDAGLQSCTNKGVARLSSASLSGDPLVVKYPKAGKYKVTLNAAVCTPQKMVSKTVWITIPAAAHRTSYPTVAYGSSRHDLVRLIQKDLHSRSVAVDGYFGPRTLAAVKAFQKAHHLVADGIVGPKTWAALSR